MEHHLIMLQVFSVDTNKNELFIEKYFKNLA